MHHYLWLAFVILHRSSVSRALRLPAPRGEPPAIANFPHQKTTSFDVSMIIAAVCFVLVSTIIFLAYFFVPKLLSIRSRKPKFALPTFVIATPKLPRPLPPSALAPRCPQAPEMFINEKENDLGPGFGFDGLSPSVLDMLRTREMYAEDGMWVPPLGSDEGDSDSLGDDKASEDIASDDDASDDFAKISEAPPVLSIQATQPFRVFVELWESKEQK